MNTLDLSNRATLKLPAGWEILPPDPRGLFEPAWRRWHAAWDQKHGRGEPFAYGPPRKGRDALPYPLNDLWDLLSNEAEVAEGRWTRWVVGNAEARALAWFFVLASPSEEAFDDLVAWSGLHIDGEGSGREYRKYMGLSYATSDFDLGKNELRHYHRHGLVVAAFSVESSDLATLFKGLSPARLATELAAAAPRSPEGIEALVARVPASGFPGDDRSFGPATRLLQRLAASVKQPSIVIRFHLVRGKTLRSASVNVLEGRSEPFWMAAIHSDPPQCQTLREVTALLGAEGKGWALDPTSVDVKCKRPKAPADAITALVRDFLVEALAGGGAAATKKAPAKKVASTKKAPAKKAPTKKAPAKRKSGA
ncbi:hypothetical protein [Polyangium fumosum]|uniref:Uncharacterized protein n=1 Tax=Polyangium fumosum TaxID=889272 RepID=A0A4U1IW05_9BACT|nr:hypothetical protein [Polyangium fumosum]TKC98201.1 hypothetical protein E8A74_42110 [Polyangium fumosum]